MIVIGLNVTKIPRDRIVPGKNGKYIDLVLFENRDGPDKYGNSGFVSMSVSKEEREAGTRGAIIGNWKHVGNKPAPRTTDAPRGGDTEGSDVPF